MNGKKGIEEQEEGDDPTAGMSPFAKVYVEAAPYLGIGWFFVFSIGALTALGWWLDRKLGTGEALFIVGAVLGILIGFANFFKVIVRLDQRKKK